MGDFLLEQVAICCWRGHLRVCFNISHFLLTRMQFSTWTRFPIARCRTRTERSVSVGRYQTETRWCSFFVKSHVGALSLEPSDISMLHNSHNRCTYYIISTPLPTYLLSTSFTWKPGQGFRHQVTPTVWFWSKAVEGFRKWSTAQVLICGPCRLLSRNSVETNRGLSLEKVRLKMWCIWSKYEQYGRMSAPGTSCSKETELPIRFMNHHRDYWERSNMY